MFARVVSSLALLGTLATPLASASAEEPDGRVTVVTHFDIIPSASFNAAFQVLKDFTVASQKDPGVLSFTLITWAPTGNHFQLIEVYSSLAAFNAHTTAPHTIRFRNAFTTYGSPAPANQYVGSPIDERRYTAFAVENRRD